jgi:hypothetical protein
MPVADTTLLDKARKKTAAQAAQQSGRAATILSQGNKAESNDSLG